MNTTDSKLQRRPGDKENAGNTFDACTAPWPNPNEIGVRSDDAAENKKNLKKFDQEQLFDLEENRGWTADFDDEGREGANDVGYGAWDPDRFSSAQPPSTHEAMGGNHGDAKPHPSADQAMVNSEGQSNLNHMAPHIYPGAVAVPGPNFQESEDVLRHVDGDRQGEQEDEELVNGRALFPITTARVVNQDEEHRISTLESALRKLQTERQNATVAEVVQGRTDDCWDKNMTHPSLTTTSGKRVRIIIAILIIAFAVAVIITLVVVLRDRNGEISLMELIVSSSPDHGKALGEDLLSPQYRAFAWLQNNEGLSNFTNERKLQRYALATLYYSTSGFNWTRKDGWLSNENECNWEFRCDSDPVCNEGEDALFRI